MLWLLVVPSRYLLTHNNPTSSLLHLDHLLLSDHHLSPSLLTVFHLLPPLTIFRPVSRQVTTIQSQFTSLREKSRRCNDISFTSFFITARIQQLGSEVNRLLDHYKVAVAVDSMMEHTSCVNRVLQVTQTRIGGHAHKQQVQCGTKQIEMPEPSCHFPCVLSFIQLCGNVWPEEVAAIRDAELCFFVDCLLCGCVFVSLFSVKAELAIKDRTEAGVVKMKGQLREHQVIVCHCCLCVHFCLRACCWKRFCRSSPLSQVSVGLHNHPLKAYTSFSLSSTSFFSALLLFLLSTSLSLSFLCTCFQCLLATTQYNFRFKLTCSKCSLPLFLCRI